MAGASGAKEVMVTRRNLCNWAMACAGKSLYGQGKICAILNS